MKIFKMAAILTLALISNLVSAHSGLKHSTPENGAMLIQSPEDFTLEFTAQVKLVRLQLTDQSGKSIKLNAKPSNDFKAAFSIALPVLEAGSYNVKWLAMGEDAHKLQGDIPFTVKDAGMAKTPAISDADNDA
ncbi:copper resistance protein CopC [Psychromonas ingrahamii 37]|uniref:Copper resistance protein C n=1 Tax=Psychromonas ingrahamii (strain DSM 17664 / CCUG 51855 / 37) TaxID=357804 RepID=A1SUP2_PSYIN|nr:copper resistance CopC family protein [Psychromonas ingrahamii]ABM03207.1 copper resistance protein CopC [Psychromonas ingrahamii 37]